MIRTNALIKELHTGMKDEETEANLVRPATRFDTMETTNRNVKNYGFHRCQVVLPDV